MRELRRVNCYHLHSIRPQSDIFTVSPTTFVDLLEGRLKMSARKFSSIPPQCEKNTTLTSVIIVAAGIAGVCATAGLMATGYVGVRWVRRKYRKRARAKRGRRLGDIELQIQRAFPPPPPIPASSFRTGANPPSYATMPQMGRSRPFNAVYEPQTPRTPRTPGDGRRAFAVDQNELSNRLSQLAMADEVIPTALIREPRYGQVDSAFDTMTAQESSSRPRHGSLVTPAEDRFHESQRHRKYPRSRAAQSNRQVPDARNPRNAVHPSTNVQLDDDDTISTSILQNLSVIEPITHEVNRGFSRPHAPSPHPSQLHLPIRKCNEQPGQKMDIECRRCDHIFKDSKVYREHVCCKECKDVFPSMEQHDAHLEGKKHNARLLGFFYCNLCNEVLADHNSKHDTGLAHQNRVREFEIITGRSYVPGGGDSEFGALTSVGDPIPPFSSSRRRMMAGQADRSPQIPSMANFAPSPAMIQSISKNSMATQAHTSHPHPQGRGVSGTSQPVKKDHSSPSIKEPKTAWKYPKQRVSIPDDSVLLHVGDETVRPESSLSNFEAQAEAAESHCRPDSPSRQNDQKDTEIAHQQLDQDGPSREGSQFEGNELSKDRTASARSRQQVSATKEKISRTASRAGQTTLEPLLLTSLTRERPQPSNEAARSVLPRATPGRASRPVPPMGPLPDPRTYNPNALPDPRAYHSKNTLPPIPYSPTPSSQRGPGRYEIDDPVAKDIEDRYFAEKEIREWGGPFVERSSAARPSSEHSPFENREEELEQERMEEAEAPSFQH